MLRCPLKHVRSVSWTLIQKPSSLPVTRGVRVVGPPSTCHTVFAPVSSWIPQRQQHAAKHVESVEESEIGQQKLEENVKTISDAKRKNNNKKREMMQAASEEITALKELPQTVNELSAALRISQRKVEDTITAITGDKEILQNEKIELALVMRVVKKLDSTGSLLSKIDKLQPVKSSLLSKKSSNIETKPKGGVLAKKSQAGGEISEKKELISGTRKPMGGLLAKKSQTASEQSEKSEIVSGTGTTENESLRRLTKISEQVKKMFYPLAQNKALPTFPKDDKPSGKIKDKSPSSEDHVMYKTDLDNSRNNALERQVNVRKEARKGLLDRRKSETDLVESAEVKPRTGLLAKKKPETHSVESSKPETHSVQSTKLEKLLVESSKLETHSVESSKPEMISAESSKPEMISAESSKLETHSVESTGRKQEEPRRGLLTRKKSERVESTKIEQFEQSNGLLTRKKPERVESTIEEQIESSKESLAKRKLETVESTGVKQLEPNEALLTREPKTHPIESAEQKRLEQIKDVEKLLQDIVKRSQISEKREEGRVEIEMRDFKNILDTLQAVSHDSVKHVSAGTTLLKDDEDISKQSETESIVGDIKGDIRTEMLTTESAVNATGGKEDVLHSVEAIQQETIEEKQPVEELNKTSTELSGLKGVLKSFKPPPVVEKVRPFSVQNLFKDESPDKESISDLETFIGNDKASVQELSEMVRGKHNMENKPSLFKRTLKDNSTPVKDEIPNEVIDEFKNVQQDENNKTMKVDFSEFKNSLSKLKELQMKISKSQMEEKPQLTNDINSVKHNIEDETSIVNNGKENVTGKQSKDRTKTMQSPRLVPRPPVVTIMGHVDHGKTTLLDALRNANVVDSEFGGITQHIGAFTVKLSSDQSITFLDTPGHAAFSAMRARGASVTDIIVLVVAAEDGIMPQTIESIQHAQAANVPLIVAINKIDKPKADVGSIVNTLTSYGVVVEDLGGDVQMVPISALKGMNLDKLQDCIAGLAEFLELKGDVSSLVEACVIETHTDIGLGRTSTIVIEKGTLRKGDYLLCGSTFTKVRTIYGSNQEVLKEATPGMPVKIGGWKELPEVGELVQQYATEKELKMALARNEQKEKEVLEETAMEEAGKKRESEREEYIEIRERRRIQKAKSRRWNHKTRTAFEAMIETEKRKKEREADPGNMVFPIIIKGDVSGSVEAIVDSLQTFNSDLCELDIVHYGVGNVTQGDLDLAAVANADIYAFNLDPAASKMGEESAIRIRHHNVIYHLFAELIESINKKLPHQDKEEIIGEATVMTPFEVVINKQPVQVAGCRCTSGQLMRSKRFRLFRGEEVVFDGPLHSLKHHKHRLASLTWSTALFEAP
ncbi:translation initiation factor IF-2-like isoform X2 [Mya arenaria]|uniref:translation initiation factor IF-2-like isoform X2 n=1 Tax=Mya arenaria TaxID=6604 RepID=UPI0022E25D23|nr:translation initiation factor IF-2-like isoform X2 [Mya arenaria]